MRRTSQENQEPFNIWTPLYRGTLDALLAKHAYTQLHLSILHWLIWLPLLSREEVWRLARTDSQVHTQTELSKQLRIMANLGLLETIQLREPSHGRQLRYYVTDLGLYLYHTAVHPSPPSPLTSLSLSTPPLSMTRLVRSYPVERDDLLARLARPDLHLTLSTLVTRLIAEGEPLDYHLISYQQPWQYIYTFSNTRLVLASDAALLIQTPTAAANEATHDAAKGATQYAFLVHVDTDTYAADQQTEKLVQSLLDARQRIRYRQSWPSLLIISTPERLAMWARLLQAGSLKRTTQPLAGGITTLDAMAHGIYTPIWYDLAVLATSESPEPQHIPRLSLAHLLQDPASAELAEQFSQQRRFFELRLREATAPPPRAHQRLKRYVGDSLQQEAALVTRAQIEAFFVKTRRTHYSTNGAALLTLALTEQEKEVLAWVAHHPLLDISTLQALLHPTAKEQALKPLQQKITHLFNYGLLEVRLWPVGKTPLEQQRYLLTPLALKFIAIRRGTPFSFYFVHPKYQQESDDEQLKRQWGTKGLVAQMPHTHGLYTFMRQLYQGTYARGERLLVWKSAHEAARWYRDPISQQTQHARPDAELLFAPSPASPPTRMLLEYDRGTTGAREYDRKFRAYLDYQQATSSTLPLMIIVTPSHTTAQRIQRALSALTELGGSLQIVILLERDVLAHGLTLALHPP